MATRKEFLHTMACAALGAGLGIGCTKGNQPSTFNINKGGLGSRMSLRFFPYELQLRHTFTVATSSRTTTQGVQVEIEYEGLTGYGEASMPPYLQKELGTLESVQAFLKRVQDIIGEFDDPFKLEEILARIDSMSESDAAAKAAVDIALHDLVGKMLGAPWYKIWGFDAAKAPSTTFTIGIDTPEDLEKAERFLAAQHL